jgi:hypothetical protein
LAAQPPQDDAQRLHAFFGNSDKGFFAEVGIRAGSPTWPLERAGWNGVLVERLPDVAAFLVTARTAKVRHGLRRAGRCRATAGATRRKPSRVGQRRPTGGREAVELCRLRADPHPR